MKKSYGRKMHRQYDRRKNRDDRAYPEGTRYEEEGIKKTKRYANNRQKIGNGLIHRAGFKTIRQLNAGKK